MTVVLGIALEGRTHLISDSYIGDGDYPFSLDPIGDPKQRKIGRSTVIAFCGESTAVPLYQELIEQTLKGNRHTHTWIRDKFPLLARKLAREADLELPLDDTGFLLAKRGRIYSVTSTLIPYLIPEGKATAIGCGRDLALGAFDAQSSTRPVESRLLRAMTVTANRCPYVVPPFHMTIV